MKKLLSTIFNTAGFNEASEEFKDTADNGAKAIRSALTSSAFGSAITGGRTGGSTFSTQNPTGGGGGSVYSTQTSTGGGHFVPFSTGNSNYTTTDEVTLGYAPFEKEPKKIKICDGLNIIFTMGIKKDHSVEEGCTISIGQSSCGTTYTIPGSVPTTWTSTSSITTSP